MWSLQQHRELRNFWAGNFQSSLAATGAQPPGDGTGQDSSVPSPHLWTSKRGASRSLSPQRPGRIPGARHPSLGPVLAGGGRGVSRPALSAALLWRRRAAVQASSWALFPGHLELAARRPSPARPHQGLLSVSEPSATPGPSSSRRPLGVLWWAVCFTHIYKCIHTQALTQHTRTHKPHACMHTTLACMHTWNISTRVQMRHMRAYSTGAQYTEHTHAHTAHMHEHTAPHTCAPTHSTRAATRGGPPDPAGVSGGRLQCRPRLRDAPEP